MPLNTPIQQNIPKAIRRLPVVRDAQWMLYTKDTDVKARTKKIKRLFPVLSAPDESLTYSDTTIFAMSARVGSTALLRWLKNAGLSDIVIREIFNNRGVIEAFIKEWETNSLCGYLNEYARRSGHGRLPFKIGWWDMAPLIQLVDGRIEDWFPNATWVYLERRDKVAQAYSLWKAAKYGVLHREKDIPYSCPVSEEIPIDSIRERIQLIKLENDQWKKFFDQYGITPHCVYYEDFLENPKKTMSDVYSVLTSEQPNVDADCPLIRTSDETDMVNVEYLKTKLAG